MLQVLIWSDSDATNLDQFHIFESERSKVIVFIRPIRINEAYIFLLRSNLLEAL